MCVFISVYVYSIICLFYLNLIILVFFFSVVCCCSVVCPVWRALVLSCFVSCVPLFFLLYSFSSSKTRSKFLLWTKANKQLISKFKICDDFLKSLKFLSCECKQLNGIVAMPVSIQSSIKTEAESQSRHRHRNWNWNWNQKRIPSHFNWYRYLSQRAAINCHFILFI